MTDVPVSHPNYDQQQEKGGPLFHAFSRGNILAFKDIVFSPFVQIGNQGRVTVKTADRGEVLAGSASILVKRLKPEEYFVMTPGEFALFCGRVGPHNVSFPMPPALDVITPSAETEPAVEFGFGRPLIARVWLYDGMIGTLSSIQNREPEFRFTYDPSYSDSTGALDIATFQTPSTHGVNVTVSLGGYIVHVLKPAKRWFATDADGLLSFMAEARKEHGPHAIDFANCQPPEIIRMVEPKLDRTSQMAQDAADLARERAEVGAKMLKVLEQMRDNMDTALGSVVSSLAIMNERDQNKEELLAAIDGNLLRMKAEFLRVFEVGMENGSTVGNHSILSQMRHCVRVIMETMQGHPGIVVGMDLCDKRELPEIKADFLKAARENPGTLESASRDERPRAMLVTLTPGNVRAILAEFKATEDRSIHVIVVHTSILPIHARKGQVIVKLFDGRQELWVNEEHVRRAYPDAVWLERELPEPSEDRLELDSYFAAREQPVRQTGAARPASEATLPGEKLIATPEQLVELEQLQSGPRAIPILCEHGDGAAFAGHLPAKVVPMPDGWHCPTCMKITPYLYLPDASRLVQEEAADARRAHDQARETRVGQQRKVPSPLPVAPLPEYDMTRQIAAACDAYNAKAANFGLLLSDVSGVRAAIISAINAFNEANGNISAQQIEAQQAAVDGDSSRGMSREFREGMWAGLGVAAKIVKGEVE